MAKAEDNKDWVDKLSANVAKHGLATVLAITLVAQLIYTNYQNTEKLESINRSQVDIAKSLTEISTNLGESARVMEKIMIRLEDRHGK